MPRQPAPPESPSAKPSPTFEDAAGLQERDVTDGRAVQLRLTDAGLTAAEKLARARAEKFDGLMASLPEDKRDQVLEGFKTLVEVLDAEAR